MSTVRTLLKKIIALRRFIVGLREGNPYIKSYSQLGEDAVVRYVFKKLKIKNPTYIDIGANDPERFNNTALLYQSGSRGINIEPNPTVFKELAWIRKGDVNLNIGVAGKDGEANFYLFNDDKVSTFSKEEAERNTKNSPSLSFRTVTIPTLTVWTVIQKYAHGVFPDFLSIDIEGLDEMVLQSINYPESAPKVICVETARLSTGSIESFLVSKGYIKLSENFLNAVFCKKDIWDNR